MVLIGELDYEAELFSTSVRLNSVAVGLKKILEGEQIEGRETEHFEWAGDLVGQMDWNSIHYHQGEHPELCVIATRLRPNFYETLRRLKIPFDAKFSEGIYETLKSCGKKVRLGIEELGQVYQVIQSMARDNLTELQCAHRMGYI